MGVGVVLCRSKSNVRGVGSQCSKVVFGCFRGWPHTYYDFQYVISGRFFSFHFSGDQ